MKKILIYGPQGSGKSHYASNMARIYHKKEQILTLNHDQHIKLRPKFLPGNHKVVIIDEFPECELPSSILTFNAFDYAPVQPEVVIVCMERSEDFNTLLPDVKYIRMPDCIEISVERTLMAKYADMIPWIEKTNLMFEEYAQTVYTFSMPDGKAVFELSLVATRV
jgi:energy-coupling factor transporter ATP-binding protein EcfA2